jgi:hypothetical protein
VASPERAHRGVDWVDEAKAHADRAEKAAKVAVAAAKKTRPIYVGPGVAPAARGNERVFNETRQNEYLEARRTGRSVSAAAKMTGVTMTEVYRVRKLSPAFAEAEKMVDQERADGLLEEFIEFGRTTDPKLLEKALKWLDPERFGDQPKRVEKTVTRVTEVGPVLANIAALQARLAERKALSAGGQSAQPDDVIDVEAVEDDGPEGTD